MKDYYDALYKEGDYWSRQPSPVSLLLFSQYKPKTLLDLGAGQGPDAMYFAIKDVRVTAVDISPNAITDLKTAAQERQLPVRAMLADMRASFMTEDGKAFDAIFSRMALQMIPPKERAQYIADLKVAYPDALHAHVVPISGACFGDEFICDDQLLKAAYADWNILVYEECWTISRRPNKDGEPFLMREARIIAKK
jgi:tellurite methyltransferase